MISLASTKHTHTQTMDTILLKAIWGRYGNLTTLYACMSECEDTVLVNLSDDLDYKLDEEEILNQIQKTL